jgi:hypothetical protein
VAHNGSDLQIESMAKPTVSIDEASAAAAQRVEETPLSPQRAFVVQFRERTGDAQDRFEGRVEHIISGRAARFRSAAQLTRFMRRVLNGGSVFKKIAGGQQ